MNPSLILPVFLHLLFATNPGPNPWISESAKDCTYFFQESDRQNLTEYKPLFEKGVEQTTVFFAKHFPKDFDIYIHPSRTSLDSTWQKDWNFPEFKSECWMVASGVGTKLDIISPKKWDELSCEHKYSESQKTQNLITHELVHVFHGQHHPTFDFSTIEGLDWFVEGLAVYASGQLDENRLSELRFAIQNGEVPAALKDFWTGKYRYGLSGSVVAYIDQEFGRQKLFSLLKQSSLDGLLADLKLSEAELLEGWKRNLTASGKQ